MKGPKCNGELQVVYKTEVSDITYEVIGICEN